MKQKNHGGLSSATDISSLLYSWKLLLLFPPLHVKTSGGELLQCICSETRLEALHDLPRSGGCLAITGFTILPGTTLCIYLSCSSDKTSDGIDIKSSFTKFSMHLLTAWQQIVKLYFTSGHGMNQAQVAGELQEERGTSDEMSSPVSPNHSV